ncbi:MAG: sedoheptulokinase [Armatimonadota bacterium]
MRLLLGVDMGTTKICAIALNAETGAIIAVESAPNNTRLTTAPEASEQHAQAICDIARGCIARLMRHARVEGAEILALGVTGQMHGVVIVDACGVPLTPLINWQDQRGHQVDPNGESYVDGVLDILGDDLARTGCRPATGYGAVTLYRLAQEAQLPEHGVALTIQDLLVRQLTGVAATDPSDAASWGIFNTQDGTDWLPEIAHRIGLPAQLLPPVYATGSTSFPLREVAASSLGLPAGLAVAVAIGDNQASFLGSVPDYTDSLLINLGTGGQMSVAVNSYSTHPLLETRPLIASYRLLVGSSLCGGRAYQLLAEFYREAGKKLFGIDAELPDIYEAMGKLSVPAQNELLFDTRFSGTRQQPGMKASLTGLGVDSFTPEHMTQALCQGMVSELVEYYQAAKQAGANPVRVVGAGNGVRRNEAVRAEIIRQTGLPLVLPQQQEEAAVGAALTAGLTVGVTMERPTGFV